MAKKKSNESGTQTKLMILAGIAFALMVGYLVAQNTTTPETHANSAEREMVTTSDGYKGIPHTNTERLIETRPILMPEYFDGRVRQIYQWATEIPEAFDALYCYCRCKENPKFNHKTLLTCFTDMHAANCGVCLDEGQMAHELTQMGKTPAEIRMEVDNYYAKRSH
ncbi:MAG: PCYCGC domain-containing protein [Nitrospinota bacterium]|nr:PCYCGC domain-containing protein [Nitrospinota bacterium]